MKLRGRTQICYCVSFSPEVGPVLMKYHPGLEGAPSFLLRDHPHHFLRSFQGQMSKGCRDWPSLGGDSRNC